LQQRHIRHVYRLMYCVKQILAIYTQVQFRTNAKL